MDKIIIVSGLSGAGKTQVLRCLEDLGYFCVDNLPPTLIPKFIELCAQSTRRINKIGLVVDVRGGEFFNDLFRVLAELDTMDLTYEILFLEASDETLVRRYKETRRRHPLGNDGETLASIREERSRLQELRGRAHKIIDTSDLTVQQLKNEVIALFGGDADPSRLVVTVMSFGYKYGIPLDSDLVMDVRFLPNPHYQEHLCFLTGNDPEVQEFIMSSSVTLEFMRKFCDLIDFLIPHYIKEGKTSLMIAIGCTGGKHRSVTLANRVGEFLKKKEYRILVRHRDLNRS